MFGGLKRFFSGLVAGVLSLFLPGLALADSTINASKYGTPLLIILAIVVLAVFALWAIRSWTDQLVKLSALLPRILTFIVIAIAVLWIIIILFGIAGVHII